MFQGSGDNGYRDEGGSGRKARGGQELRLSGATSSTFSHNTLMAAPATSESSTKH